MKDKVDISQQVTANVMWIPLAQLLPHPDNPRGEITAESVEGLATTIKEKGVEQPLKVVPIRRPGRNWDIEAYRIVIGHRRRKACEVAGMSAAPCIVEEMDEAKQRQTMMVENLQRQNLTPLEEAQGYKLMLKDGHNQNDIARLLGVTSARVGSRLSIFKLPKAAQALFASFQMPTSAVPYLLKIADPAQQLRLAQRLAEWQLTVPKLKEMVRRREDGAGQATGRATPQPAAGCADPAHTSANGLTGWPTDARADALAALDARNGGAVRWTDTHTAMESTCAACELTNRPMACARCPLPTMVQNLISLRDMPEKELI